MNMNCLFLSITIKQDGFSKDKKGVFLIQKRGKGVRISNASIEGWLKSKSS